VTNKKNISNLFYTYMYLKFTYIFNLSTVCFLRWRSSMEWIFSRKVFVTQNICAKSYLCKTVKCMISSKSNYFCDKYNIIRHYLNRYYRMFSIPSSHKTNSWIIILCAYIFPRNTIYYNMKYDVSYICVIEVHKSVYIL